MESPPSPPARFSMVVAALPGIVLHLIVSIVAGIVVFFLRFSAAGCAEIGRSCNFVLIGVGQNTLGYVLPAIWGLTAVGAIIYSGTRGRPAHRLIALGGALTVVYLLAAAGLTLLGAYVL